MKIVVIGGVALGASFAAKMRRLSEDVEITIFEKSGYISYANCGLPYYLSRTIDSKEKLIVQNKDVFSTRFNVNVNVNSEVKEVDFKNKKVIYVKNNEINYCSFDKLVIGTGSKAFNLNFLENKENVFTLKNVEDTIHLDNYIKHNNIKNAVVLGSGFIGLEVVENLMKLNIKTTVVELSNQILSPFDEQMAFYAQEELINKGVEVLTNTSAISYKNGLLKCSNDVILKPDLIISAVGVIPNTDFLKDSELKLDERGFVEVNEYLQTNIDNVYAGGDIIKSVNKITNQKQSLQLANLANYHGVLIANNIFGKKQAAVGAIGVSIIKVMDMTLAQCGINEKTAKSLNIEYKLIDAHLNNHASYYPNSGLIHFKILINPENGLILGAQGSSLVDGVDKRIDLIAFAIKNNITIDKLSDLETSYSPQFGSAKDPIVMLGYIGKNILENKDNLISYENLTSEHELLFVVENDEIQDINLDKINNISLSVLRDNLHKLDKNKHYVISCKVGARAHSGVAILRNNGFKASNLSGGYLTINNYLKMRKYNYNS